MLGFGFNFGLFGGNRNIPKALVLDFYAANDMYFVKRGPELDYSHVDGSEPLVVDGVLRGDPAYTNVFTGPPTGAESVTLTAQDYCLQMQGSGSVVCSYGTATAGTPLVFTATAGDTEFAPTSADAWMLTAGKYIWPVFIEPGATSTSYAGAMSFDLSGATDKSLAVLLTLGGTAPDVDSDTLAVDALDNLVVDENDNLAFETV